ncbi:MAG: hypothetical protein EOP34_01740 [Rickettsiales bacterium]|nr:MAG: hypothetical protein EOP34_01740 [Rickettsiales bacterium]
MNTLHLISSPLDQFEIRKYLSLDAPILLNTSISLTNIGLYVLISLTIIVSYHLLATNRDNIM